MSNPLSAAFRSIATLEETVRNLQGAFGTLPAARRTTYVDVTVPTNCSLVIVGDFEISSGTVLELESDGVLEIL